MEAPEPSSRPRPLEYVLAALGYALAACVLLYPIFVRGNGEIYLPESFLVRPIARWVMWILSWDVHALTSPAVLFDANVFHPAPDAIAFGDPLLGILPLFAPSYLVTGDPVVSYQLTLLATIALCGAGMYYLARHWGVGVPAAALAGLVYAHCPARVGVLGELPHLSDQFLPLALVFADRTMRRVRLSDAALLFLFASWQALCGTQVAYASLLVLAVYLVTGAIAREHRSSWSGFFAASAAFTASVAVLALSTAPYRRLVSDELFTGNTMRELAPIASADLWRMFLVPPYLKGLVYDGEYYLGGVVLLLAVVGAVWSSVHRRRALFRLLVVAGMCYWLSLGLGVGGGALALYGFAVEAIPGFATLGPAPSRFVTFLMLAIAGLTAFGADLVLRTVRQRGAFAALVASSVVLVALLADYRLPFQRFETQRILSQGDETSVYATLAALPSGAVLELPIQPCAVSEFSTVIERQLASTVHWKPLLDGYRSQGRAPATYEVVRAMANSLPDPRALALLRRATGMRYVVVHLGDLPGPWRHRWRAAEGMTRLGFFGHDLLFELDDAGDGDLQSNLLSLPRRDETLTGSSLAVLDKSQREARLSYSVLPPHTARVGTQLRAEMLVENRSSSSWPALTTKRDRKVFLSYLWADAAGGLAGGNPQAQPLPLDLAPGESVVVPVCVQVPGKTGDLELSFGLTQAGEWFEEFTERLHVNVIEPRTAFWTARSAEPDH